MKKSFFICIEGLDGCGKTTQAKLLAESLNGVYTKEPSDLPIGKLIREYLKNEKLTIDHYTFQLMYAADRGEHVEKEIMAGLESNQPVITDRYFFSSIAFGAAMGLDFDWLNQINRYFPVPDICIYLDTPIELCLERLKQKNSENYHELFETSDTLKKVKTVYEKIVNNYDQLISTHPRGPIGSQIFSVDGTESINVINQTLLSKIQKYSNK